MLTPAAPVAGLTADAGDTARAGEQIGVVQALLRERVGEGLHHMLLPHHFGEIAGAVLAGEHDVGHAGDSTAHSPRTPIPARPVRGCRARANPQQIAEPLARNRGRSSSPTHPRRHTQGPQPSPLSELRSNSRAGGSSLAVQG